MEEAPETINDLFAKLRAADDAAESGCLASTHYRDVDRAIAEVMQPLSPIYRETWSDSDDSTAEETKHSVLPIVPAVAPASATRLQLLLERHEGPLSRDGVAKKETLEIVQDLFPSLRGDELEEMLPAIEIVRKENEVAKLRKQAIDAVPLSMHLIIVGDSGVGKTCLLLRYCGRGFGAQYVTTIGMGFKIKEQSMDGRQVKLKIWDTAGDPRCRTISLAYMGRKAGIVVVFDVTDRASFNSVPAWVADCAKHGDKGADVILCGNKCDFEDDRVVAREEAEQLAAHLGVPYAETSAKQGLNVATAVDGLASRAKSRLESQARSSKLRT